MAEFECYDIKHFYRGRRIHQDDEPPEDLTRRFLDFLTTGLVHPGWSAEKDDFLEHYCDDACAIEACIIIGQPYTQSVMEAVKR